MRDAQPVACGPLIPAAGPAAARYASETIDKPRPSSKVPENVERGCLVANERKNARRRYFASFLDRFANSIFMVTVITPAVALFVPNPPIQLPWPIFVFGAIIGLTLLVWGILLVDAAARDS